MNGIPLEMKIYTRRGDRGQSSILNGEAVYKDDPRLKTYGALDELQSHLGMARSLISHESVPDIIRSVQSDIFTASSELASTPNALQRLERRIGPEDVTRLERWIDEFTETYGLPTHFVAPGESLESAVLHVARSVCRRGERLIVTLNRQTGHYDQLITYFNRLGDLIFVLAWAVDVMKVIERVVEELTRNAVR
ncbi:MAG: cob(I)yrinic acid a,c-diamide adenosyltransferase [Deltaproteobacteria bacterium]|nr:cob(I)yrinic acid a,c-diamide adenosyltransferase [Deltaproteobacteria bacterium]